MERRLLINAGMSQIRIFAALAILAIAGSACNKNPSTPSDAGAVTIIGTVTAPVPSGLAVTVGGTSNSAQVDGAGQFTLSNVPAGTVDLRFAASGTSASLVLSNLLANQTVTLVANVSGGSATLVSARRVRGNDEEVEGNIESVTPPTTFVVAGRTVSTTAGTTFIAGLQPVQFDSLAAGQRITVKGQASSGALMAASVNILTAIPIGNMSVTGAIGGFTGTRSAFQFSADGTPIQADDATTFDSTSQFNELADGLTVQISGIQRAGHVYAARITITSRVAAFSGRIVTMTGQAPQLVLQVFTQAVAVNTTTSVQRKGDPQDASTLANGQTIDVIGRIRTDGTVAASLVNILTDAPGGQFVMTGTITTMGWQCPKLLLTVTSYTVTTDGITAFVAAPCDALAVGDRVEVRGIVQPDLTVAANSIKKL